MTSLQRITPAREQTLQTADDRGVYNDGKSNSFILIIKKKYLKYIYKKFLSKTTFHSGTNCRRIFGTLFFKVNIFTAC